MWIPEDAGWIKKHENEHAEKRFIKKTLSKIVFRGIDEMGPPEL